MTRIAAGTRRGDFFEVRFAGDSAPFSHGRMIRKRSICSLMFFKSAEPNFSNRASSALRICRSTSIETQMPPAPANCSMRDAMFPVAVDVAAAMNHIAVVNADFEFDAPLGCDVAIPLGQGALDLDRALRRF